MKISTIRNPNFEKLFSVLFLRNFFISREAATAERRYEKERWSENYLHMAAFSTRTCLLPLSPTPPPLLTPPSNAITRAVGLHSILAPPPPPEDYRQILATSPKVENGLHFRDCEYGS